MDYGLKTPFLQAHPIPANLYYISSYLYIFNDIFKYHKYIETQRSTPETIIKIFQKRKPLHNVPLLTSADGWIETEDVPSVVQPGATWPTALVSFSLSYWEIMSAKDLCSTYVSIVFLNMNRFEKNPELNHQSLPKSPQPILSISQALCHWPLRAKADNTALQAIKSASSKAADKLSASSWTN